MDELYFVTGNENKFKEASDIIPKLIQKDIDLPEIQSLDIYEITRYKLEKAFSEVGKPVVVEDQSIIFDGLKGLPGPLIKWFLKSIGNEGLVRISETFSSQFAEALVLVGYFDGDKIKFFEGKQKGKIVTSRGENGFGWDSIFLPDGSDKTFGEMTFKEKNAISSRKVAFSKLKEFLDSQK